RYPDDRATLVGRLPRASQALGVEARRTAERAGEPVEGERREDLLTWVRALEVAVVVAPGVDLLDDPGPECRRRIGQVGERLRPGRLELEVGEALRRPTCRPLGELLLLRSPELLRRWDEVERERHRHVEGADRLLVRVRELLGDEGAPVEPVDGVAPVPE